MRRLLNTLYVLTEGTFLSLDGENVVARLEGSEVGRIPLHSLEAIKTFSRSGATPALMGACAERGIALSFFGHSGRFLCDVHGATRGNVLLRKRQCLVSDEPSVSLAVARNFVIGKVFNCKWVLERTLRDHALRIDVARVEEASDHLSASLEAARTCETMESLRGIEGDAAASYFSAYDELFLRDKEAFSFRGRSRRPPRDRVNAMLSFLYTILMQDCSAALEGVGLDPYVGFLHVDRPGRRSLALDCMEELRPVFADRFVATAINNRVIARDDFVERETGEIRLSDKARRSLLEKWQARKKETVRHPFLKEKMPWGLVPHVQAQLLSKYIRGELDGYPPFLWK